MSESPPQKKIYIYCLSHLHFICISSLHLLLLYHEHNLVLNLFIISRTLYNMILINNLLAANITVGTLGTDLTLSPTCQSSALGLEFTNVSINWNSFDENIKETSSTLSVNRLQAEERVTTRQNSALWEEKQMNRSTFQGECGEQV